MELSSKMEITNGISTVTPDALATVTATDAGGRDWSVGAAFTPGAGLTQRQRSFTEVLSQATGAAGPRITDEQRARETAQDFVAMAFVQPLLKQLRESNRTAAPFGPSKGEQQFGALMDAQVARNVVKKSNWPVVDRLARDMLDRVRRMKGEAPGDAGSIPIEGTQNT